MTYPALQGFGCAGPPPVPSVVVWAMSWMRRTYLFASACGWGLLLVSCGQPAALDSGAAETCVLGLHGWASEDPIYYREPFHLSVTAEAPEISLDQGGETVDGTWVASAGGWDFEPDAGALLPNTEYRWIVLAEGWCGRDEGVFSTSGLGLPVTEPSLLLGRTFDLRIDAADDGLIELMFVGHSRDSYRLRIDALDGGVARVTLALSKPPGAAVVGQDLCRATMPLTGSWIDGSVIQLDGDTLPFPVGPAGPVVVEPGVVVALFDWSLEVAIHPDGTEATLAHLSFDMDTRTLGDFHTQWTTAEDPTPVGDGSATSFCSWLEADWGAHCEPCADGSPTCLPGVFRSETELAQVTSSLVDLSESQLENHLCADSCTNGLDDDGDGNTDSDPECDPGSFP